MMYKATIECYFYPEDLYKCLVSEKKIEKDRGTYIIKRKKGCIAFIVSAKDAVALRATLNSITQLIAVFEKSYMIENGRQEN